MYWVYLFFDWAAQNIAYLPVALFIGFFLGGLNLPVSEDLLIIFSSKIVGDYVVSTGSYAYVVPIHIFIFLFAWMSDWLVYLWGNLVRRGSSKIKKFEKTLSPENLDWISKGILKYKCFGFICCRFVPFGIRNALSLCSGFIKLPFKIFILYDGIAAFISTGTLYYATYFMGKKGGFLIKIIGICFLVLIIGLILFAIYQHKKSCKNSKQDITAEIDLSKTKL